MQRISLKRRGYTYLSLSPLPSPLSLTFFSFLTLSLRFLPLYLYSLAQMVQEINEKWASVEDYIFASVFDCAPMVLSSPPSLLPLSSSPPSPSPPSLLFIPFLYSFSHSPLLLILFSVLIQLIFVNEPYTLYPIPSSSFPPLSLYLLSSIHSHSSLPSSPYTLLCTLYPLLSALSPLLYQPNERGLLRVNREDACGKKRMVPNDFPYQIAKGYHCVMW